MKIYCECNRANFYNSCGEDFKDYISNRENCVARYYSNNKFDVITVRCRSTLLKMHLLQLKRIPEVFRVGGGLNYIV